MRHARLFLLAALLVAGCSDEPMSTTQQETIEPAVAIGVDSVSGATIETNQDDYAPGEVVHVTGRGWAPHEIVRLVMTEEPDTHDDVVQEVQSDSSGRFSLHFYDVQAHDLGVVFTLVATGLASGSSATATFTDGNYRVIHTAGMPDFNGNVRKSTGNNFCGGIADSVTIGLKVTALTGTTSLVKVANTGQSLSFAVPATVGIWSFSSWTVSAGVQVVGPTTNPANICLVGFTDGSFTITANYIPQNTAPVVHAGNDGTIPEGGTFAQNGSFTDSDANSWTATVDYGDGSGVQALGLAGKDFSLNHVYTDNGAYTVTVTVNDGTTNGADQVVVTVTNVPPAVNAGADITISGAATFARTGSFTDPGADSWSATVDYGDGAGAQPLTLASDKTFSLSHVYQTSGVFTVTVTVTDDDGASHADDVVVTVANTTPAVAAGQGATISEASTFAGSGSYTDPDADTWTATVDYGDGTGLQPLNLTGKTFNLNHVYHDNGTFNVTVTVHDGTVAGTDNVLVTVTNVPPSIQNIGLPTNPSALGELTSVTWTFTDPGEDVWTCAISWDAGAPFEAANYGSTKSCSASRALAAGVYTVTVRVADDDGGADQETATSYIVVYDPNDGFVTGGGWINSPAGAYLPNPTLAGKATFGFVSRYEKGKTLPQGNTEFQFNAAGMNFKSTAYELLVVAGSKAQYKGEGVMDKLPGVYGFLLTAVDGNSGDGADPDRFRIKIWNKATGAVVYDNQLGEVEDSESATVLSGGSIVIHTKK